jgi:hypothetical protein
MAGSRPAMRAQGSGRIVNISSGTTRRVAVGVGVFTLGASPRPGMVVHSPDYAAGFVLRLLRTGEESFGIPHGPEQPGLALVPESAPHYRITGSEPRGEQFPACVQADTSKCSLTCGRTGPSVAAHVLLSSRSQIGILIDSLWRVAWRNVALARAAPPQLEPAQPYFAPPLTSMERRLMPASETL